MAQFYKDVYGRTYSPSQVEKVGGSYYVAGTSINVSPVSSSSGSKSSSTTTSASKSSSSSSSAKPAGTTSSTTSSTSSKSSSSGSKTVYSSTISPEQIIGYDPNWFINLPPEIQQKANAERQKVGATPLPTDRPLTYEESGGGTILPSRSSLSSSTQQAISSAEQQAFAPYIQQQQQQQLIDALQARIKQLENQLTNWQSFSLPSPTDWVSPSLPTTQTPPPTVETAPQVENVPATAAPQQTTALPAGVSQGAGGFTYQATAPPVLPTVDKLLETYRQVFGKADQDVQQYLQSPEFQTVLRGNVPMWMEADPLWRRYLQLLGISRRLQQNQ